MENIGEPEKRCGLCTKFCVENTPASQGVAGTYAKMAKETLQDFGIDEPVNPVMYGKRNCELELGRFGATGAFTSSECIHPELFSLKDSLK